MRPSSANKSSPTCKHNPLVSSCHSATANSCHPTASTTTQAWPTGGTSRYPLDYQPRRKRFTCRKRQSQRQINQPIPPRTSTARHRKIRNARNCVQNHSTQALVEHQLNWIPLTSEDEGRYLITILNADGDRCGACVSGVVLTGPRAERADRRGSLCDYF